MKVSSNNKNINKIHHEIIKQLSNENLENIHDKINSIKYVNTNKLDRIVNQLNEIKRNSDELKQIELDVVNYKKEQEVLLMNKKYEQQVMKQQEMSGGAEKSEEEDSILHNIWQFGLLSITIIGLGVGILA